MFGKLAGIFSPAPTPFELFLCHLFHTCSFDYLGPLATEPSLVFTPSCLKSVSSGTSIDLRLYRDSPKYCWRFVVTDGVVVVTAAAAEDDE